MRTVAVFLNSQEIKLPISVEDHGTVIAAAEPSKLSSVWMGEVNTCDDSDDSIVGLRGERLLQNSRRKAPNYDVTSHKAGEYGH